jgi:hypothetical protein
MSARIPVRMREEYFAYMAENDDESLDDREWYEKLEKATEDFFKKKFLIYKHVDVNILMYLNHVYQGLEGLIHETTE